MAAGDAGIIETYNAGNQPKQRSMAEDWNRMKSDYSTAMSTAKTNKGAAIAKAKGVRDEAIANAKRVRDESIAKAEENKKLAKQQRNRALSSGDQTAVDAANKAISDAEAAKKQAYATYDDTERKAYEVYKNAKAQANTIYDEDSNNAEAQYKLTHDSLRSAEKEHNSNVANNTMNLNRDLADIQREETEELSKQFSSGNNQSGSGNQKSDNGDNNQFGSNNQGSGDGGKDMDKDNKKKNTGFQLSQSFYDSIGNAITGRPQGNIADLKAKGAAEQAQNLRNASATNQMEAQRSQQIANQNPYAEAGKIASVQNDVEDRQNVRKAGVLGAGAALARKTNTPDIQSQIQREDQQQAIANQRREEEQANQQEATEKGNESEQWKLSSRDYIKDKDQAAKLSMGEGEGETKDNTDTTKDNADTAKDNTDTDSDPGQKPKMPSGNPRHVINALLGSSLGEDLRSGKADAPDKELYDWAISQGVTPIQAGQHKNESDANSWEQEFIANNGEAGQTVMQQLRQGRVGEGNDASRNFSPDEVDQMNKNMTVKDPPSDARVKDIKKCLCDARMKWIKEDWDRDGRPSRDDMLWLINQNGLFHHNDKDYDPNDYDSWGDEDGSLLGAYANNIKNYVYNYKPEATQVDPNIDPNQEHIGPMAQDIEHVNPACVKETPEGVKTVDTSRLAMMNAGVIGDLAREIQDIKMRLAKLGV